MGNFARRITIGGGGVSLSQDDQPSMSWPILSFTSTQS